MAEPRIGVVGATGAVGSVTLELLAERGLGHVRAFASSRSAGTTVPYGELGARRRGGDEGRVVLRRARPVLLLRRHRAEQRARAGGRRRRCGLRRQVVRVPAHGRRSARRAGGERRPRALASGHRRQPELLDDPARLRARPAPRGCGTEERARRHLSVRIGRGSRADGGAPLAAGRRRRHRHGLGLRGRRVRRGVEAPRRDAEDPRAARSAGQRDLRTRARPRRPLASRVDRDGAAPVSGRGPRGAGRRAGSYCDREADPAPGGRRRPGARRPDPRGHGPETASPSGSSATTCARGRL